MFLFLFLYLGLTVTNSLGFGPTNSLGYIAESLIFFLLLYNQVEGTSFQSISLTNLNLSTIKLTFMSNPNFPIRPMNNPRTPQGSTAQERAQQFGPLPVGFTETYTQPTQGRTRSFTTPQTPVFFPPPNSTPGSSYTSDGVVYNTHATKKVKSSSGVLYTKPFRANLVDKARLDFVKQIEPRQQTPFLATTILVTNPSKLINHYSLSKTVAECKRSMCKYGINAVFTVVKPFYFD